MAKKEQTKQELIEAIAHRAGELAAMKLERLCIILGPEYKKDSTAVQVNKIHGKAEIVRRILTREFSPAGKFNHDTGSVVKV